MTLYTIFRQNTIRNVCLYKDDTILKLFIYVNQTKVQTILLFQEVILYNCRESYCAATTVAPLQDTY